MRAIKIIIMITAVCLVSGSRQWAHPNLNRFKAIHCLLYTSQLEPSDTFCAILFYCPYHLIYITFNTSSEYKIFLRLVQMHQFCLKISNPGKKRPGHLISCFFLYVFSWWRVFGIESARPLRIKIPKYAVNRSTKR